MVKPQAQTVFEISWEVCNKVGGIYSVITSKATYMKEAYDAYYAIGPYVGQRDDEFIPQRPPKKWRKAIKNLEEEGINVHYGVWKSKVDVNTVLLDTSKIRNKIDHLKTDLWEHYKVDTLNSGTDVTDPILLSYAAARLLQELGHEHKLAERTVLHAHEWLTGFTTLFADQWGLPVSTVFTTHATMLGRTVSGKEGNLYETLNNINPDQKAQEHGVQDKHSAERAAAHTANVFTTVSEVTSKECEALLGRRPDVIVVNGIDVKHFPSFEDAVLRHREKKKQINEFLSYAFYPYYTFNQDNNLNYLFAGRYEYENKGIDVFLDSLKELNEELKGTGKTITTFLCIAMPNEGPKYDLLRQKVAYEHLNKQLRTHSERLTKGILYDLLSEEDKTERELMQSDEFESFTTSLSRFKKREGTPPLCTHKINEDNQVIQKLKELGLTNKEEHPVKVLLYPAYLDGNDGLLNLSYFDMISASDLGVYPSYYEPWGYTPVETAGMAIPTVTTDLAGFGKYIKKKSDGEGIHVVPREQKTYAEIVESLKNVLKEYAQKTHKERVKEKLQAQKLSKKPDWEQFKDYYIEAHNMSL